MPSGRPAPLLLAIWLAAVLVATTVGVAAVRLVADQVGDPAVPVLSSKEVGAALTATPRPSPSARPGTTASPLPTRSPTRSPAGPARSAVMVFTSQGGTVGVRCRGTAAERVYSTPAQGYVLDETSVNGNVLEVRFRSADGRTRVRLEISCGSGTPVLVERRVDTSGGGKG